MNGLVATLPAALAKGSEEIKDAENNIINDKTSNLDKIAFGKIPLDGTGSGAGLMSMPGAKNVHPS